MDEAPDNSKGKGGKANDKTQDQTKQAPTPMGVNNMIQDTSDFSKFIPGEGTGKEFLKTEIERMIMILRKKQECADGVRIFRRVDPGAKPNPSAMQNHPGIGQSGRYEEIQFAVASLFAGRGSNDKMAGEMDDEYDHKDEESERDRKRDADSMKNTIKSRKAFQMAINDKAVPPAIQRLSRVANVLLLCIIALAIVDYSINYTLIKEFITNF